MQEQLAEIVSWIDGSDPELMSGNEITRTFPMPSFELLRSTAGECRKSFQLERTLVDVTGPVTVVGDIHGHLGDLVRILRCGWDLNYVFLGDYVDRGNFSLEVMVILLFLKWAYPSRFILLRGNHEFEDSVGIGGFRSEINKQYGCGAYRIFMDVFAVLPFAAVIDGRWLCLHGGLGLCDMSLQAIRAIHRPIMNVSNVLVESLVWSDPDEGEAMFRRSPRGLGFLYGSRVVTAYLEANGLLGLIRGHESIPSGVRRQFDGKVVTVFSASNYCGTLGNESAVLDVNGTEIKERMFRALPFLRREVVKTCLPAGARNRIKARAVSETPPLASMPKIEGLEFKQVVCPKVNSASSRLREESRTQQPGKREQLPRRRAPLP